MKVSEPWLRSMIGTSLPLPALAEQLNNAGIEVDSIETVPNQPGLRVLALKVPPNRGDCLSMQGIVRELSALNNLPFKAIEPAVARSNISDKVSVKIDLPISCPRYVGRIIKGINLASTTPDWMRDRLEAADIRCISPIVDITNYVMLELGQPMHAFDLSKIDAEITVRYAKPKERIITLDKKDIILDTKTLVIADKLKVLAIAGVIGGEVSSVQANTQDIFLESAYFNPVDVRRAAKHYGLRTDSSFRFERGVDPELQIKAMERASQFILEILGGQLGPLIISEDKNALPKPSQITLRTPKIKRILGVLPSAEVIKKILNSLGMKVTQLQENFLVDIPSFRSDLALEVDLIEEIARVYGYHHIPSEMPHTTFPLPLMPEAHIIDARVKTLLVDRGYHEAITYSFVKPALQQLFVPTLKTLDLLNPISEDLSVMRSSLWPGLVQSLQYNALRQQPRLRLFEMGVCFLTDAKGLLQEKNRLAGMCMGAVVQEQWGSKTQANDFYDVKADIEALLGLTGRASKLECSAATHPALHPGQSAALFLEGNNIGYLGALHPMIIKTLDLPGPIIAFEINMDIFRQAILPKYQVLSKYPAIRRDIALLVDKEQSFASLQKSIVDLKVPLLREVFVFDVYQGKGMAEGKKSIALGLVFQDPGRTLVETDIHTAVEEILLKLKEQCHATLRES